METDRTVLKDWLLQIIPPQVECLASTTTFGPETDEDARLDVMVLSHDDWLYLITVYDDQVTADMGPAKVVESLELNLGPIHYTLSIYRGSRESWEFEIEVTSEYASEFATFLNRLESIMKR